MKFFLKSLVLILLMPGAVHLYAQNGITADAPGAETGNVAQQLEQAYTYGGIIIAGLAFLTLFFLYKNNELRKKTALLMMAEQEQRARADKAERQEQQFLANVSQEMRTPMNTVMGMTDLTLDTQLTQKQKQYLTAVKKSSENLLVIITDVLDRSKHEYAQTALEDSQFSLRQQIQQLRENLWAQLEEKHLELQADIATDVPDLLSGDPTRLTQVLKNLCKNAIRDTDKGAVRIVIEKAAGTEATLCFKVTDPGMSIPAHKVSNIFETFHQTDPATWQQYKGSDIGLSIAKTIVELEGGEMSMREEAGIGSEFVFTITYEKAEQKAAAALPGIKILVAEDNEYNQVVITDTLETIIEGALVDLAENGKIALEKHRTNDYDIILMDVQMPEMDGLEATEVIRKTMEGKKKNIPIIALTAGVLNSELDMCFAAGMNDYIPKPFTRTQLFNTLARYYKNEVPDAAPAKQETNTLITDLTFLADFCKDDKAMMQKYIDIYLKVTPGNLEKINIAATENDHRALARTVHAMKAHLNYMGMKQTRKVADSVETYAKEQNNLDELPQLIYKLREDCERSMSELRSFS